MERASQAPIPSTSLPEISVVVLNYNGLEYLGPCFASLQELEYPADKLELMLVDNNSSDRSVEFVEAQFPTVRVVRHPENYGYGKGNNLGAKEASGQLVAFLNPDMRVDRPWLIELVQPLLHASDVICAASKILTWDGQQTDYAGLILSFYGYSHHEGWRKPATGYDQEKLVLAPCGGAMLVDREIFLDSGGFDGDYFAFYEDLDLGWRLWLMGYKVAYAPRAIAYHVHHGLWKEVPDEKRLTISHRNAFSTIVKNYDDENLSRILPVALLLYLRRALVMAGVDPSPFRVETQAVAPRLYEDLPLADVPLPSPRQQVQTGPSVRVAAQTVSLLVAADDLLRNLDTLMQKRQAVQRRRRRSDQEIFKLFVNPLELDYLNPCYVHTVEELATACGICDLFEKAVDQRKRVLIVSGDAIGSRMSGPAIRDWEYARALSRHCRVTLAVANESDLTSSGFDLRRYDSDQALQAMVSDSDVVITSGYVLKRFPFLKALLIPLVLSIPHSFVLENIQRFISAGESQDIQWDSFQDGAAVLNEQLVAGDFFVCNSERQRDYWIGMLAALGRVNPATYADDPSLHRLVDVVSFGLPDEPPEHRQPVLKGVYKGIAPDDKVLFWGGGLYDWLDPLTLIRAMPRVLEERSDVVAFFAATRHPSPNVVAVSPMCRRAMRLSDELGLTDRHVYFHDWIPYEERESYLLEADLGLSLHLDHVETRFAFRNRILDYIWAGLPIIATEGDTASELVRQRQLGAVAGYQDASGLAQAILDLLATPNLKATLAPRFAQLAGTYRWEQTTRPLAEFCCAPRLAPDRGVQTPATPEAPATPTVTVEIPVPRERSWGERSVRAWHSLRQGGLRALRREISGYLRWKVGR